MRQKTSNQENFLNSVYFTCAYMLLVWCKDIPNVRPNNTNNTEYNDPKQLNTTWFRFSTHYGLMRQ